VYNQLPPLVWSKVASGRISACDTISIVNNAQHGMTSYLQEDRPVTSGNTAARRRTVRTQAEVTKLGRELDEFQERHDRIVGVRRRGSTVKAAIEELNEERRLNQIGDTNPLRSTWVPPADYVPVEEQYRRVWTNLTRPHPHLQHLHTWKIVQTSSSGCTVNSRAAFIPISAQTTPERARRTEIMNHINVSV
jgi:hypothetical protein